MVPCNPSCSCVPLEVFHFSFPGYRKMDCDTPANGWRCATLAALAALLVLIGFGARAADETPAAEAKPPAVKVAIVYLGKAYEEPPPLSLLEKILTDEGSRARASRSRPTT